jgi:putative DNA primase/helicase
MNVRIVELPGLPDHGDVSDWFDAGHTADELKGLVTEATEWDRMADLRPQTYVEAYESRDEPEEDAIDDTAVIADGYRCTDAGNASRLIAALDGKARYVHAWGKWIIYRQGRWVVDEKDALVTERAKRVAKKLFRLLPTVEGKDDREALFKWAVSSESSGRIAAMVRLARGIEGVIVEHEELDADPLALNVTNGTIDLATGELRPHNPADLCTKQVAVAYDPDATAPLWEACLKQWQPDAEMRDYLQLEAGAGATGKPTETLSMHFGPGANGKSKFWGGIQRTLGSYSVSPHKSLLLVLRTSSTKPSKPTCSGPGSPSRRRRKPPTRSMTNR